MFHIFYGFTSKKIKERFRTDIPEIHVEYVWVCLILRYIPSVQIMLSGGLISQTPPLLGFRQIPAY